MTEIFRNREQFLEEEPEIDVKQFGRLVWTFHMQISRSIRFWTFFIRMKVRDHFRWLCCFMAELL